MTTSISAISQADGKKQYYEKITDQDGKETFVAVTVPIGKEKQVKKSNKLTDEELDKLINVAKEELRSDDKKTRKKAEKELKDLYRQKGYSKKAAKSTAERDAAVCRAELRTENVQTNEALANLKSEDKKTRKNAEKELVSEYKNTLTEKGYSKKEAKKAAEQYVAETKAEALINKEETLKAQADLKDKNKETAKNAENTLKSNYKNIFIKHHYSEKTAERLAEKRIEDNKAQIRFENCTTFDNKEEYKAARKAAKENGEDTENYVYLSKKSRKFAAENPELFYEDGKYSSDKGKEFTRTEILQNQDYRAELNELDDAAEKYNSKRKVMGEIGKDFHADVEDDKTKLYRGLYVTGTTAAGTVIGTGAGAAIGSAFGKTVEVNTAKSATNFVTEGASSVLDVAEAGVNVVVDSNGSATTAGAVTGGVIGGLGGLAFGLATMNKIKDNGEGDHTEREIAADFINEELKPDETPVDHPDNPPVNPEPKETCVAQSETETEIVEQEKQPACKHERHGGETWKDIIYARYGLKPGDKYYKDLLYTIKHKYNDIPANYNDIPKITNLYDYTAPDGTIYACNCDNKVVGTLKKSEMSGKVKGSYGKAPVLKENVEQTNYYYRSGTRCGDKISWDEDRIKVADKNEAKRYAEENGCEFIEQP